MPDQRIPLSARCGASATPDILPGDVAGAAALRKSDRPKFKVQSECTKTCPTESVLRMFRTREPSLVPPETKAYTSAEVARIARVSLRQLQWWDERRVVSPDQDNHKRLYQPNQVIEVSVIAELRRKGFSLQNIRRVLRFLEKELRKRLSEVLAPDSEIHLLTDGKSIYLEDAPERIIDLLKDARHPMQPVSIHAPRAGRDCFGRGVKGRAIVFQSTRPARGATGIPGGIPSGSWFQSTRPAR